jgi:hypothetical protein
MADIHGFGLKEMVQFSQALRSAGAGAATMEAAASGIVRYLYDHLTVGETGEKALALARFFKTHAYEGLDEELQAFARGVLGTSPESPGMRCLTLLASAGEMPEWNSRRGSSGHKAIPLPSEELVERFPMIRHLVQQLGLEINAVVRPDPALVMDMAQKSYNVFHVPEAVGSPYVPAQSEFVMPCGIRSAVGFGGMLPSGNLFAVILFFKCPLSRDTAALFKTLALAAKIAVLPFDGGRIFS